MSRLLHNHNGLLARPNCRHLRGLFNRFVPTDRWEGQVNGRLQFPAEVGGLSCDVCWKFISLEEEEAKEEEEAGCGLGLSCRITEYTFKK